MIIGVAEQIRTLVAVAAAARRLAAAGVSSSRVDAEMLAAHVLGVPRGALALTGGFTPAQQERFDELVDRRSARVPLQHLTGAAGFGHLELAVGPGVFLPRPETELLAQWASQIGGAVVVDLCSGAGALALEIAHACPQAEVIAVESSPSALRWLRQNAADRAAAGDTPVTVVAGDAIDPATLADQDGVVELVVSNPPYVPSTTRVPPEVARHDPPEAVFAGPDGLAVIRPLIARAAALLRPGGWFGFEHDETQAEAAARLVRQDGRFTEIGGMADLTGRPRFCVARRIGGRLAPREAV